MRVAWLMGALMVVACGGRQAPSPTTVSSGGANLPTETSMGPEPDSSAITDEPFDIEAFAKEPSDEDPPEGTAVVSDPSTRRDIKMMSYEEAMALPIEIGDATSEGGEQQLSASVVARIMDGHLDEMYEQCIRRELERGNPLGTVTVDLAIRGSDGIILGATIEPGRRRFKRCLLSYLEDVRFPTFASPRMGARYRFHTS